LENIQESEVIQPARESINWGLGSFLTAFHIAAVAALFMWNWQAIVCAVVLYWIAGSLGIGMGYHRLITHRGYKVPKALEYFLVTCGSLALQGGPIEWTTTHRIHHAHTDRIGDPHTPRDGRLWSHVGWILRGTAQNHEAHVIARYAPDLSKDRYYVWLSRYYPVPGKLSDSLVGNETFRDR